ncbi:MAG: transglycosylase domain-containing protein [Bryobacteraceae bacterium]
MNLREGHWDVPDSALRNVLKACEGLPRVKFHPKYQVGVALLTLAFLTAIVLDFRSSWAESRLFAAVDRRTTFSMQPGSSPDMLRAASGPYDQRLGLSRLGTFVGRLEKEGYVVEEQARGSRWSRMLRNIGLFPVYPEKNQTGLLVLDRYGNPVFSALHPKQIYPNFEAIPPLAVNTLLFIENRNLENRSHPYGNPAIEWDRLARAVMDLGVHTVYRKHKMIGGSTLATQLEKMRHSPNGRTPWVGEKIRQVASASLRAYENGPETLQAQRRIICDYINSIPLAASPSQGEVIGLADGLRTWYGADFQAVNRLLIAPESTLDANQMGARARAYRRVLSLFLALRAPTWYLIRRPDALVALTDRYLRVLAEKGVISARLRDLSLRAREKPLPHAPPKRTVNFVSNKSPNAVRTALLRLLGVDSTYALDRLDLTARTTLDGKLQESVNNFLKSLADPSQVEAAGLYQYQLLDRGNPGPVIYSFTLYERGNGVNLLRVQTDNYNQPLDINRGTKLQLGSTAKLRTLILYLQIVAELHGKYATMSPEQLRAVRVLPGDNLTGWALSYLSAASDKGLEPMLEAALQRKYSGNPGEAFFTAGGLHHFVNFEPSEDSEVMTVSEGFQRSVNLVFIRLMRDIERYYMFQIPGASPSILSDPNDPARHRYLARYADLEGSVFLKRFFEKYRGQTTDEALDELAASIHLTPLRAAVIYRSVRPQAGIDEFSGFLHAHPPAQVLTPENIEDLYKKYGPDKFNLRDRGYLAHVHPLELWLLNYRERHPEATLADVYASSANERQDVYQWLFKTRYKHAQDKRILTLLEIDAFKKIHGAWQKLGYPFDTLVPSYATSIGVSGDTPAALAGLVGIILNDGVKYPAVCIRRLQFANGTPFDTVLGPRREPGKQVLTPVIARLVRREMVGVVENGTGRRARGGIELPDGTVVPIGGKTGTGDNRFEVYGPHGSLVASRVVNRTAAFTFFIGDRFFGTVIAFVPGETAARYKFTSALAVQVLKDLIPSLMPSIERAKS